MKVLEENIVLTDIVKEARCMSEGSIGVLERGQYKGQIVFRTTSCIYEVMFLSNPDTDRCLVDPLEPVRLADVGTKIVWEIE